MALVRLTRNIENITVTGNSQDYLFSAAGGILLSIKLTWYGYTFLNQGTEDEVAKGGDIHVLLADSNGGRPILGHLVAPLTTIVVPQGGSWEYDHPFKEEILASSGFIEKLNLSSNFDPPEACLRGFLRVIASADPVRETPHSLSIEADLLAFDVNIT